MTPCIILYRLMCLYESGIESYKSTKIIPHNRFIDYMNKINVNNREEFNEYDNQLNRFNLNIKQIFICIFILITGYMLSVLSLISEYYI